MTLFPVEPEEVEDPEEPEDEREARIAKEKHLRFLMSLFPFHYCVACHKCVSPIEQGLGRFCVKCDYGHILRLATFNDMKRSRVPEFSPLDGAVVNEVPAFVLLEKMPKRLAAAHQTIELVMKKFRQVRSLVEELQDLHALTMKNQLGVDAETKAIMQEIYDNYPSRPNLKQMWNELNHTIKCIDSRFSEVGGAGFRPDLAQVCYAHCTLHGSSDEVLAAQSALAAGLPTASTLDGSPSGAGGPGGAAGAGPSSAPSPVKRGEGAGTGHGGPAGSGTMHGSTRPSAGGTLASIRSASALGTVSGVGGGGGPGARSAHAMSGRR